MKPALLGTKIGMTRVLADNGDAVTVTVVKAGPCVVLQRRTTETDGYEAVQLGLEDVRPHRSTMPLIGHAAKAKTGPKRFVREIRLTEPTELQPGDVVTVEQFSEGVSYVDVVGTTKGKGFAGVMKRHNFGGKEASHGVERKHRSAGGIGGSANAGMGRGVKKGKRMAGHMGDVRCTATNLRLVKADCENGLLLIKGSVPGSNGSLVMIRKSKKKG
ncbi:MAG: 50S ribosomal protein L3 [Planctomycetes bacterium]|nr:50S ribosomal protein L3 [Planctomycetota bacterium]